MEVKSQRLKKMCAAVLGGLLCAMSFLKTNCPLAWERGESIAERQPAPSEMVFLAAADSNFSLLLLTF